MTELTFQRTRPRRPFFIWPISLVRALKRSLLSSLSETAVDIVDQANYARDKQDWQAAANHYKSALARPFANPALHVQLGHALKESGHYADAESAYLKYLKVAPDDADIHLQLGHLFNRQNKLADAICWYESANTLAPANKDIAYHLQAAKVRFEQQQDEATRTEAFHFIERSAWVPARRLLKELLASGRHPDLVGILANVTKECGAFEEAEQLYARYRRFALDDAPQLRSDAELQTGHLHQAAGALDKALHHYIKARHYDFEQEGFLADNALSDREVRSCVNEIYTCFWDCKSP